MASAPPTIDITDLDIRLLLTFEAVVEHRTFGRAAAELGYTQSAVSQQIARLEQLAGGPLFIRPGGPKPVEITRLGEVFASHADSLLERARVTARDLNAYHAGDFGEVHVGTFQSMANALLPAMLTSLSKDHADVRPVLYERDSYEELIRLVRDHVVDLTFVPMGLDVTLDGLETLDLLEDPYVLIARPGRFPAGPVDPKVLDGEAAIGDAIDTCQVIANRGLATHGVQLNLTFRTIDNATVKGMVKASDQISVMPLLSAVGADPDLAVHELDPPIPPRRIGLVWRSDADLSPASRKFIDIAVSTTEHLRQPTPLSRCNHVHAADSRWRAGHA